MMKTMGVIRWLCLWAMLGCVACGGSSLSNAYGGHAQEQAPSPAMAESMDARAMEPPADYDHDRVGDMDDMSDGMLAPDGAKLAMAQTGAAPPPPPGQSAPPTVGKPPKKLETAAGPMLIYTANFTVAIFEVDDGLRRVEKIARDLGGFLARRDDATITIRVPVAEFDAAVSRIEGIGDVLHRNISSEDVTEEFRDLGLQLKNLRALRDRLAKLLDRAETVEDAIKVERELGRVSGQIDRIEGRMKFLGDRAAMSTLTVEFHLRATDLAGPGEFQLPIGWLHELGLGRLLSL